MTAEAARAIAVYLLALGLTVRDVAELLRAHPRGPWLHCWRNGSAVLDLRGIRPAAVRWACGARSVWNRSRVGLQWSENSVSCAVWRSSPAASITFSSVRRATAYMNLGMIAYVLFRTFMG
jgi:hypothetical protein